MRALPCVLGGSALVSQASAPMDRLLTIETNSHENHRLSLTYVNLHVRRDLCRKPIFLWTAPKHFHKLSGVKSGAKAYLTAAQEVSAFRTGKGSRPNRHGLGQKPPDRKCLLKHTIMPDGLLALISIGAPVE